MRLTLGLFLITIILGKGAFAQTSDSVSLKPKGFVFAEAAYVFSSLENNYSNFLNGSAVSVGYQLNRFSFLAQFDRGKLSPRNFSPSDFNYETQFSSSHFKLRFNAITSEPFKLFIQTGIGSMNSNTKGDLKNNEGVNYHIWQDGTLRNLPEISSNFSQAVLLNADGNRETTLSTLKNNVLSVGIGAQFQLHPNWSFVLQHQALFFDKQDFTALGFKDYMQITQLSVGLRYQFISKQAKKLKPNDVPSIDYSGVDYEALENGDEDGDGVTNRLDECPLTPKGLKVNSLGCPPDVDSDGVYDQFDDELTTLPGAWVDAKGVTLSEGALKKKALDSTSVTVNVLRRVNKNSRPYPLYSNETYLNQVKSAKERLPEAYRIFDGNNDGKLSENEMKKAINDFFDKKTSTPAWLIYQAIEYRFQQQ